MPIHRAATIDSRATIHPTATIGPQAVVDGPVTIGPDCYLGASAVVMGHTEIGAGCRIHPHAVVGDVPQDRAFAGGVSYCRIGEGCTIREGATVHRGTAPGSTTTVGARCLLMTGSHVAHNCQLGEDVTLISGALLGGYVEVGRRAVISGNVGIHQFVRIGELAMVSILATVTQDIPPFFIANREGAVIGVNRVGLARAGCTALEKEELKIAFRVLYRSGLSRGEAAEILSSSICTPAGTRLLAFLSAESARGIAGGADRRRRPAELLRAVTPDSDPPIASPLAWDPPHSTSDLCSSDPPAIVLGTEASRKAG